MKVLWEVIERQHTRYGFYLKEDTVVFEYSGPFDQDTSEWINVKGTFSRVDFIRAIQKLTSDGQTQLTGNHNVTMSLKLLPSGRVELNFTGGYPNNLYIRDLGVRLEQLTLAAT